MKLTGDRCQCTVCNEYFNSTYAFDKHRYGPWEDRYCMNPEEMKEKGMDKNANGFWVTKLFTDLEKVLNNENVDSH